MVQMRGWYRVPWSKHCPVLPLCLAAKWYALSFSKMQRQERSSSGVLLARVKSGVGKWR